MRTLRILLAASGAVMFFVAARAADVPGSKDHPVISRYSGSEILKYETKDFDSFSLPTGQVRDRRSGASSSQALEGRITRIHYRAPEGRSALEVFRNYEQSLKAGGFTSLYQCENQACGNDFSYALNPPSIMHFSGKDQKYLAARLSRPTGDVYVSVYTTAAYGVGGANKNRVFTLLDVVEVKPMQTGQVVVDANAMAREIAASGRVALYGIYFDSGKADVKPESQDALVEIAKLMKQDAALKLLVVGHTDTAGAFDYNIDLSRRRAQSVVQALVSGHGVDGTRLKPWGVGYAAPVASNRAEDGRAKNRRVELVAW
ncbi:membrane protein [Steroidobacter agaridevorans]|uniref:Membrane protein n=1 Tax=Steroidobacter agaridevorans TaxID=2695856 RepID=A0A829YC75_9GAMM|nr:OmpA family protein [Steroidobacter agaridevorans]GFE80543.1 membrane protein [Steroidobacter agaridevorans]GFE87599.1 membrane protein [Steroidobacter agaridevorans]